MINIAIDGHVGSGKSTLAKGIAQKLGYDVFDTGALYRGIACEFLNRGFNEPNEGLIDRFSSTLNIEVKFVGTVEHVIVNGKDYTDFLRLEPTSVMAGKISPFPKIRAKVLAIQRGYAQEHNVVMEGRDIGTEVLPNADFKFFVTAQEEVRAKRRFDQFGKNSGITFEEVLHDLRERDYSDEHRKVSPLKPAADSIILDNTNLTLEECVDQCVSIIKAKLTEKQ